MYAGLVTCCPLVSNGEYAQGTDRRTPIRDILLSARREDDNDKRQVTDLTINLHVVSSLIVSDDLFDFALTFGEKSLAAMFTWLRRITASATSFNCLIITLLKARSHRCNWCKLKEASTHKSAKTNVGNIFLWLVTLTWPLTFWPKW